MSIDNTASNKALLESTEQGSLSYPLPITSFVDNVCIAKCRICKVEFPVPGTFTRKRLDTAHVKHLMAAHTLVDGSHDYATWTFA
jgi:hypothetical protein